MKLGLSTFAYTWSFGFAGKVPAAPLDAFTFLHKAAGLGARVVQIADNVPLDTLSADERRRVHALAKESGIQVEVGMRGLIEEKVLANLAIAKEFQSPVLRIVTDTSTFKPDPAEIVAIVRRLKGPLEAAGIALAIENHDRFTAPVLASIIADVASPCVGICLDTVNSFGALETPEVVIETLGPLAVNVHLKDFTIKRPWHSMGFLVEGTAAGEGRLKVPYLLERMKVFGREPNLILETWVAPEERLEDSIAKEQDWTARGFANMRRLIPD
jgi:sugar phosphate isomerase/epimerase